MKPLAERMRPAVLDQIVGQQNLIGPRGSLRSSHLPSLLLWGPPGCGKTTLAYALASESGSEVERLSAVTSGIKDLKEVIARAREKPGMLLIIDEIHRWNKSQQDALLPHLEDGTITLIGATTENPAFEVNAALRSRLVIVKLLPLTDEELSELARRALLDEENGLGFSLTDPRAPYILLDDAKDLLLLHSSGDARKLLTGLETATTLQPGGGEIDLTLMESALGSRLPSAGRQAHYDLISALIKSIRGSDPSAALYWLARMESSGEDPRFVARRLVIAASEEIGLADSAALPLASAAALAVDRVGSPECWINLAQVTAYLAVCPKDWHPFDSWKRAQDLSLNKPAFPVPSTLTQNRGSGYRHPRDGGAPLDYLPPELSTDRIFEEGDG